jgi:hypothetical protein
LDAAGAVAQEIPAQIFLDTLNELLGFDRVHVASRMTMMTIEPKLVVGRLLDVPGSAQKPGGPQVVGLSIQLSWEQSRSHCKTKAGSGSRSARRRCSIS